MTRADGRPQRFYSLSAQMQRERKAYYDILERTQNERQIKVLNRLLNGVEGKLTTRKWAAFAKCSQDTALRDSTELLQHNVLQKAAAGGRSTHYEVRHLGGGQATRRRNTWQAKV